MAKLTKWEYKELYFPTIERLNDLGQRGWELVAIYNNDYTLKRPLFENPNAY